MSVRQHTISRWTFDIHYSDQDSARTLQDKFSTLFNHYLSSSAEEVIDKVLSPGESVWLSQLELDLGTLPESNFEQDIIRLLPEALERALRESIAAAQSAHTTESGMLHFADEEERHYALLAYYLRSGSLPWWATQEESLQLEVMLLRLISARPSRFAAFITKIAQQEYILKRIAFHFSRYAVERIITALEEEQATFILGYITGVITLHGRQPLVQHAQSEFERAVWLFVLTYLVTDNSGQFNRKQFIRRNLERLARHFNVDYFHLLYIFRKAIDLYRQYIPSDSFVTFIQVLYEENEAAGIHATSANPVVVMSNNAYDNVIAPRLLPLNGALLTDIPLPLLWINYDTIVAKEDREEVWQQAVRLFQTFIGGQPPPAWFGSLQKSRQDTLLRHAVVLLFRKRPLLLASLWDHPSHDLQARLHIHQLFDRPVTPLEENIRRQLQRYAEQDTIQFLQQALPHTFIQHRNSFREIWMQYRQRTHAERMTFYRNVLAPVAVMHQVALHTTEDDFWTMMKDALPLLWGDQTVAALQQWQSLLEGLVGDNLERERIRLLFRRFNLMWLSGRIQINDADAYVRQLAQFIGGFDETTILKLLRAIVHYDVHHATAFMQIQHALPVLQQVTADLLKQQLIPSQPSAAAMPDNTMPAVIPRNEQQQDLHNDPPASPAPKVATTEQEGAAIQNAGLILLHPFFPTYFSRLDLLSKGKFVDETARHRAVRLLQLLVDGGTDHGEHTLLLNKVMCNLPWEVPLMPDIVITAAEKELALQLLGAAIQQWPKMHNASVEGFRASFLKREGIIWQTEEAWFQRVQQRSYDIILQTLPWSYGMTRFSWLPKPIYTEWTLT